MESDDIPVGESGPGAIENDLSSSAVGRILDERFLVERDKTDRSLGGGFSVFLVKDLKNYCRESTLKVLNLASDNSGLEGPTLKEVGDKLARLGHRNIEEILETGRLADGRPFALAEVYSAAPLDLRIESGRRLEIGGLAQLVEQIAEGMAAAHSRGILHCDLRPSNILVPTGDIGANRIMIVNFGSAWPIDARGESLVKALPGSETLHYAAPELLAVLGHRSAASDVYSLAVLVYRLLTGTVPFVAADRAGLLKLIHAGPPDLQAENRTDLSDQARELILSGLHFEPIHRPQKIGEFGLRLVRLLTPPRGIPAALVPAMQGTETEPEGPEIVETDVEAAVIEPPLGEMPGIMFRPTTLERRTRVSDRAVAWTVIVLLMAGALSIPVGQSFLKEKSKAAAVETIAQRPTENAAQNKLKYWFEQRGGGLSPAYRHNLAGDAADPISVVSDSPGHIYIYYESVGEDGRPAYEIGFPAADSAEAVKGVESGKPIRALPPDGRSVKAAWIIWTSAKNSDLESIRSAATDRAISNDDDRRRLRHFLERNRNLRVKAEANEPSGQTVLEGQGDRIIYRVELGEVRP